MAATSPVSRVLLDLRGRAKERVALKIRKWAAGPESIFPGDPRWCIEADPTSSVTCRMILFGADVDVTPPRVGRYTGIHHTALFFLGGLHHTDWVSMLHTRPVNGEWFMPPDMVFSRGPIVVGSDVWITYEAMVMSGVTIGDGAVVAARSVVTKDVAPYEIVGGSPAKRIGWRFDEPTREALLRIRWWDWPDDKVERLRHEIDSPDVQAFVRRHDPQQP